MDIIHIVRIFTKFSINYREIIFNSLLNDATSEGCLIDEVLVLVSEWNPTILLRSRSYSSSSNLHDSISYAYYHLRTSEGSWYQFTVLLNSISTDQFPSKELSFSGWCSGVFKTYHIFFFTYTFLVSPIYNWRAFQKTSWWSDQYL